MLRFCELSVSIRIPVLCLLLLVVASSARAQAPTVFSPNGRLSVDFQLEAGQPTYRILRDGTELIGPSRLGLSFRQGTPLNRDLEIIRLDHSSYDETWTQPWGEVKTIRDHHNQMRVSLISQTDQPRTLVIVFRVFNDGVGFRYELPEQKNLKNFLIMSENTEFFLPDGGQAWWIPALEDNRYEYLYKESPIDDLKVVHTPLTVESPDGPVLSFHEAALTDYASMALAGRGQGRLQCQLIPWPGGIKVVGEAPFKTPWRTIQIGDQPGDLVTNYLVLNLNEPCRIEDTSWIKPGKYVGIWWGMHLGTYTWGSGAKHGATTANTKAYLDFAAEHGFSGVLVEGWNPGWDSNWWQDGSGFVFTENHPDFDIEALSQYAADRGVGLIGHHETGADVDNYERQLEDAFAYYEKLGIGAVKTGYVGHRCNGNQWHHGQFMVRHYRKVVETAARHHVMVDVHEPIKDTGIRRTWPNMMTREGARGQEYNAWSGDGGNPPDHTTILPFTRMLAGPFDFTPGIFDLLFPEARPHNRVNTTLAKQLALYVTVYSPLQMAADLPKNYQDQPAFQFIKDVPCDWQDTQVINGAIGDYVTIVRQDRNSDDWYLGSVTDETARSFTIELGFLDPNRSYQAEIYADGAGADWQDNPLTMDIQTTEVTYRSRLTLELAPGGGQAIRFSPLKIK